MFVFRTIVSDSLEKRTCSKHCRYPDDVMASFLLMRDTKDA